MRVALLTTFAASKKDPLGSVLERIHQAFLDAGLGEPVVRFNFEDASMHGSVSSVDRVLKRHPELGRFVTTAVPMPRIPGARRISNEPISPAAGEAVPFSTLQAIAGGVPRSFPFRSFAVHLRAPAFGEDQPASLTRAEMLPGILLTDNWWVNGRDRSLTACTVVEADPAGKKLPPAPAPVAAVLAACGKAKKTVQAPLREGPAGPAPGVRLPNGFRVASANPEAARAVHEIVVGYRARMSEIIQWAALPHQLPATGDVDVVSVPRKPALERVFKPMGYSCKGESGAFSLRRRTAGNLTAELHLDIGTWGHSVLARFRVSDVGFKGTVLLPVTANAIAGAQCEIGDAERWRKIVENLGALVAELDRRLVPEIEAKVGPSPEWYQPES